MADDKLTLKVTADASAAEAELKDLDRLADQIDLDPKVDTSGIDGATKSFEGMADAAGMLPGPLGEAAGFMSGGGGVAVGAAAAATALFAVADSAADTALEAQALQSAVGGTVEETSRLLAATQTVGLEYNDVLELIAESNKAMAENSEEARKLGVNLSGTPIQRFQQLVDAVYAIRDPLERARTASKFFGEEGSKQLPKLIGLYGDLTTALEAVPEGAVMSEEDVAKAREFKSAVGELKTEFGALATSIGTAVLPGVTGFFEALNTGIDGIGWGVDKLQGVGRALDSVFGGAEKAEPELAKMEATGRSLSDSFGAVADATSDVVDLYSDLKTATEEAREANEDLRDEMFNVADASIEAGRTWSDLHDNLSEFKAIAQPTRADVEKLNDSVLDYADAQVEAAGLTRESTEGSKLYKDALGVAAGVLGDKMNPELQAYIDKANAVPDEAVTDIRGELDPAEFNEADRLADELERREVSVKLTADVSRFAEAAARAVQNAIGGRAQQTQAARYVWRNGRYVEVA